LALFVDCELLAPVARCRMSTARAWLFRRYFSRPLHPMCLTRSALRFWQSVLFGQRVQMHLQINFWISDSRTVPNFG
jgi:hypothetical protein